MSDAQSAAVSPLARALGGVPSGLFILTARRGDRASGMLASWVQQAGFEPPMLSVAMRRDRFLADWIAETGQLTLNQVGSGGKGLIRHFGKGFGPNEPAFQGVALRDEPTAGPVLADALAFLDARVVGTIDGGDHRIFLAEIVAGGRIDPSADAEPMVPRPQERPALLKAVGLGMTMTGKTVGKAAFAAIFLVAGVGHFARTDFFERIVPPFLPAPRALVLLSGACEIGLGSLLLVPKTTRFAAWGLIALLIAVFPANLFMYQHAERFGIAPIWLLLRLPLQLLMIAWAYGLARSGSRRVDKTSPAL